MKLSTVGYHFRQATRGLERNGAMSLVSIGIIALCLLILGGFILAIANLEHIAEDIESRVEIRAFLSDKLEEDGIGALEEKITSLPGVKKVEFISKDQGLEKLEQQIDDPKVFALVKDNPLPHSFNITLKNPEGVETVAKKIQRLGGVSQVKYGKEWVDRLFSLTRGFWIAAIIAMIALVTVVVMIITNTIRLAVFARRREVEIMKLVGATDWFIRIPFLLEGMLMGFIAGVVANVFLYFLYGFVAGRIISLAPFLPWLPLGALVGKVCLAMILLGMVVGASASAISIRKYLHV
jgi:cell division transport system permease protein